MAHGNRIVQTTLSAIIGVCGIACVGYGLYLLGWPVLFIAAGFLLMGAADAIGR